MTGGFVVGEKPVRIERGDGVHLHGADGTTYLDFGASYGCAPVGHAHPDVVEATTGQLERLPFVQASYPVDARDALYDGLAAAAPDGCGNRWLCNSGTEAVETALKFARSATGRAGIVAAKRGFHGRTMGALSATWKPKYREPYEPLLEDVTFVPYGDGDALVDAVDGDTAAVILEPVQGEGGVRPAPEGYLAAARDVADDAGAALVFDEVQTGLGRTGSLWACERAGVTPDALTVGKGLASGLPAAATLCADWLADGAGPHGSTYGGGPVVAAAAAATLDVLADTDLPANAAAVGEYLRSELRAADLPVRAVRGEGLLVGVEVRRGANRVLRDLAVEQDVLALPAGRSVVRLLPPLTVTEAHADRVVDALAAVLGGES